MLTATEIEEWNMDHEQEYRDKLDTIAMHAWETWTGNGRALDEEDRETTMRDAHEAAHNEWRAGLDELEWLKRTVERLRGDCLNG
jgi:hypothetical protein